MSDRSRVPVASLGTGEVRVYTLDSGDSATVRDAARRILARQIGVSPSMVELYVTPKGKPLLRNDEALHFSISHSRDVSMIAVTRVAAVGVDIEQLRAVPNAAAILKRFFTHEEISAILTDDQRDLRFIEAWTRAESRVKVRGASVWEAATPDPSTIVRLIAAPDGFAAAVAVASETWTISQYNISVADIVTE
ncbi:MAG TPA: 4'-phosphopantetheinyl transferase superfamily protein [Gemmatimonadaceae bacterium]